MSKWISVKDKLPDYELVGKDIVILVNGHPQICYVRPQFSAFVVIESFNFAFHDGWVSDPKFAEPTHWMPLPEVPK
jgi:hypothetical protein